MWVEAIPLAQVNKIIVADFIEKHLITIFGIPSIIVFDSSSYFSSLKLSEFSLDKRIILRYSSKYFPQENGVAEAANKILINIINKTIKDK